MDTRSSSSAKLRVADKVRLARTADGCIVLDTQAGQMYSINQVGASILELLSSGFDVTEVGPIVAAQFDRGVDQVRLDVGGFVQELLRYGLIEPQVGIHYADGSR